LSNSPPPESYPHQYTGHISTEHTVWCGAFKQGVSKSPKDMFEKQGDMLVQIPGVSLDSCVEFYQFSDPRPAEHVRSCGWKKTKRFGWICPACAVKHGVK